MKINVTVDLSDFYTEYEDRDVSLSGQIQEAITHKVKQDVLGIIKEQVFKELSEVVIKEVELQKNTFITNTLQAAIVDAKVKKRYNSQDQISISEHINEELSRAYINDGQVKDFLNNQIKKTTDSISKELKDRYDLLFASQIVSKLKENGMLKDDVAKLLLE